METLSKRKLKAKARLKKVQNKDRAIKLLIVFGPVLFFLASYFIANLYFGYVTRHHNRMDYPQKVGGLIKEFKQTLFNEEKPKQQVEAVQD
jgi:hypothetical protein